jgi:hypothetical protein
MTQDEATFNRYLQEAREGPLHRKTLAWIYDILGEFLPSRSLSKTAWIVYLKPDWMEPYLSVLARRKLGLEEGSKSYQQ